MDTSPTTITLTELTQKGENYYLTKLKDKLEKTNMGDWIVIEVESGKYFTGDDQLTAIKKAKKEFSNKLFFIAKIGNLRAASANKDSSKNYAWFL